MKFLGGLLKTLSILLLLAGTILCTVIIAIVGVVNEQPDVIWVMSGVWLCVLFVFFGILGTGIALSQAAKLKKRVEHLEQQLFYAPMVPRTTPEMSTAPAEGTPAPVAAPVQPAETAAETAPAKSGIQRWLPAIIAGALVVVAVVVVVAFGGKDKAGDVADAPEEIPAPSVMAPVEMVEPETEAPMEIHAEELGLGAALSTDFVEMTFNEVIIDEDIQKSVKIDNVTRTTGPEPIPGQVYICLSGIIKNTSTSELPVYDFFLGRFQIGDYKYEVSANDCDILSADGSPESMIAPLMEYEYRIYTAIPAEMAEMVAAGEPYSFTFGFYDGFDNYELSSNRAFEDEPISLCPYQYFVPFA